MKPARSIVVGIDYSENSKNALREAARIANWNNGQLLCLHVFDEEIFDAFRAGEGFDEAGVKRVALQALEDYVADTLGAGHQIECQISVGHPFKEILTAIDAAGADLLVLGSRGLEVKSANRTGALASRCVRKAPVDVLLIRERQDDPFRNIVACIDFSENSIRAAHHAAAVASQDKASLELLHIYRSPIYSAPDIGIFGPVLPPVFSAEVIKVLQERIDVLADEISDANGGIEIHTNVEEWAAVPAGINRRLEKVGADLAVLGTRGRTGFNGIFMGTNAEKIIHHSPCSTLAVKPEGFSYKVS
jgi:universal stress protein E